MLAIVNAQQCNVKGQIFGIFHDGHLVDSYNECLGYCKSDSNCTCFTYNAMKGECVEFSMYQELDPGCSECYSGETVCPNILECDIDGLCNGVLVDYTVATSNDDCLSQCKASVDCEFYGYREDDGFCALLEDCSEVFDCQTCKSGQKNCSSQG